MSHAAATVAALTVSLLLSPLALPATAVTLSSDGKARPSDAVQDTLAALDTDRSGTVDRNEIELFATSQGLSADQVRAEFQDLDTNGDGMLSADELGSTLAAGARPQAQQAAAPRAAASSPQGDAVFQAQPQPAQPVVPPVAAAPAVASSPHFMARAPPAERARVQLDVEAVQLQVQQHASRVLTGVFAEQVAQALERRKQDLENASKLEDLAKSLRRQTDELRQTASARTVKAAMDAATAVLIKSEQEVNSMEEAAVKAESDAALRRREAKAAMDMALRAQKQIADKLYQSSS